MGKGRVEAFTDGVIAIVITIMVLELKVPHGEDFHALLPLVPVFLSYILSFIYVGIYWNNLHNMFHTVQRVNGAVLWANLHQLFWLSLIPFATAFMGENHFAPHPVAIYGFILAMCAISFTILERCLLRLHGSESAFAHALGNDFKGWLSLVIYIFAIPLTFVSQWIGIGLYVLVAVIWFVPDRRFERQATKRET